MPKRDSRSTVTETRKRLPPSAPAPALSADISRSVAGLFDRVAEILERAQTSVVLSLNSQMVLAYWHIGREVVHLLHDGRTTPHALTGGVRREGDHLVYDVGATPPLLA